MSQLAIDSTSKEVAVPAKLLLRSQNFSEQPLTFTVEENSTMESSNSGKYVLAYAPVMNFQNQLA
jgi:DNA polymerase-3 subunit beta